METVFFPKYLMFIDISPKSLRARSMVRGSCWCGISNTSFVSSSPVHSFKKLIMNISNNCV